ncbi:hypothetical protein I4U23_006044 [Adineta vaga]|nr:hypothetical protein I4U23_006044 [Adineta vaga]
MDWWFYSLWDILPVPILLGIATPPIAELISMKKDQSIDETIPKGGFSCDSLSLISLQTTQNDNEDPISSFYLRNCQCTKENEKMHSLPSIKLRPIIDQEKQMNTLPTQLSTRRSIIRDLTLVSNSFMDKKTHHSIDSLFSKDSLIE